ncbi:MAG: FtsW/RodA/SpoVE family cell cycle protein, partial [Candidatus Roizmanbacteria bacterium]
MHRHYPLLYISIAGLYLFSFFNMFGIKKELYLIHGVYLLVALVLFFVFSRIDTKVLRSNAATAYMISIALLVIVLILGANVRGAKRWFDFFIFRFQVAEFVKPFFLMAIASVIAASKRISADMIIKGIIVTFLPLFLIFLQPDLDTVILYGMVGFCLFFVAGVKLRYYFSTAVLMGISSPILWLLLHDYQRKRIIGFLSPNLDPQGITYNINQAIIAVGSGNFFGKGLGLGTQSRFQFLPEYHTDFAFASLIEQFGFLGGAFVLALYGLLLYELFNKAFAHKDDLFATIYLYGCALFMFFSMFFNVGMNLGLLPVTGIALPFISYGG